MWKQLKTKVPAKWKSKKFKSKKSSLGSKLLHLKSLKYLVSINVPEKIRKHIKLLHTDERDKKKFYSNKVYLHN
jgi:hypothetical protein